MSSSFSGALNSFKYGVGAGVVYAEEGVKSAARATGETLKDMAGSSSGQLALFALLLGVLPTPVATAVTIGAGLKAVASAVTGTDPAFTIVINDASADDDDASASSSSGRPSAKVGVSFAYLPAATDLAASAHRFASDCIEGAVHGVRVLVGEIMTEGVSVFNKNINGIQTNIQQNFAVNQTSVYLNMTCAKDYVADIANGNPIPSPPPPEATGDIAASDALFPVVVGTAGALAVAHGVLNCRRYYLAEKAAAEAADPERGSRASDSLLPPGGSSGRRTSGSGSDGGTFTPAEAPAAAPAAAPLASSSAAASTATTLATASVLGAPGPVSGSTGGTAAAATQHASPEIEL